MENNFFISNDKRLLNVYAIKHFIADEYWSDGRIVEDVEKTILNSYCFGMYTLENEQVGFARVVTDYIYFGYFMDFIIFTKFQGKGYGKKLVAHMLKDDVIKSLKTVALKTKDAHSFYQRFGFKKIGDSPIWMSIDKQNLR
ncbi:GNAT family N-acetyltransferase [Maribacter antarcticus]|uniref:GNAT family N-acetyltransferase n=1 Tax=Maribacter antarcticus TaxID=505250 RepID=UPI00047EE5EF|nr:GNAT family N-acetyltransferase [Maribacter antarcticus]